MNNEAHFGLRFAVKGAKEVQKTQDAINAKLKKMGVTAEQTSKKMDKVGKEAETTGDKQKNTLNGGIKKADELSKSLDRLVKKWLSIGGAVTIVARIIRKAFAKIDEITGLRAMATTAGIAAERIESLGKKLREYGGDTSSAASAYTSIGDVLGAARMGRGISEDIVAASARYGIALNGGMLSEDQLITNIARAMQAQRKRGNMYGVRDIASAFGIDEAMMLHLSQAGANWDRGLPAANLAAKQAEAQKAKELQIKIDNLVDELISKVLPLLPPALQGIIDVVNWLKEHFSIGKGLNPGYVPVDKNWKPNYNQVYEANKSIGMSDEEAKDAAKRTMYLTGQYPFYENELRERKLKSAQQWADYYNQHLGEIGVSRALNNMQQFVAGTGASVQAIPYSAGLKIEIVDKSGLLRNTNITASSNEFGTVAIKNSSPNL